MATKVVKSIFQFRRDTTANWESKKSFIPAAGEPCYDLEQKTLKIGDGTTTYEELPSIGSVEISGDGASIVYEDGIVKLFGFEDADVGAQLTKGADGSILWAMPNTDAIDNLQEAMDEISTQVETNKNALTTLSGSGDGSIQQVVNNAINAFATDVNNDEFVNTFKELVDYVARHAPETADIVADIDALDKNKVNDSDLAAIAKTGNVNDLMQTDGDMLIFDCGDASDFMEDTAGLDEETLGNIILE